MGFQDEGWWSRFAQPTLRAWTEEGDTLRLVEQAPVKDDPDRKTFACYGLLVSCPAAPDSLPEQVRVRCVEKRPASAGNIQFLEWCCAKLDQLGKTPLIVQRAHSAIMIWDNASWRISKEVRTWLQPHNRTVKQQGRGVRVVAFYLPSKSPCSIELSCTGFMASATSQSRTSAHGAGAGRARLLLL